MPRHPFPGGARVPDKIVNPNNLQIMRIAAGLHGPHVARRAKMNLYLYRELEKGYRAFRDPKELNALARAYQVSPDLITDTGKAQEAAQAVTPSATPSGSPAPKPPRKLTAAQRGQHYIRRKRAAAVKRDTAKRLHPEVRALRRGSNGRDPHVLPLTAALAHMPDLPAGLLDRAAAKLPVTPALILLFASAASLPPEKWSMAVRVLQALQDE